MTERYNSNINGINPISLKGISETVGSMLITGGSLNSTFNSNTIGNLYTTGGNVGVNTVSPAYPLDVNGIIRSSGSVVKATPAFRVIANGSYSFSAGYYLNSMSVQYDTTGSPGYQNGSGLLYAPVAGFYLVTLICYAYSVSYANITVNGYFLTGYFIQPNTTGTQCGYTAVVKLNQNDRLGIYVRYGTFYFNQSSSWGAILLG